MVLQEFVTTAGLDGNAQNTKFDLALEKLISYRYVDRNQTFSRSGFTLILERAPTPFYMNVYLPTTLLTMSSFIGFLIPVDVVPGRMALLATTLLMLVNMSSTERNRGPIVRCPTILE